MNERKPKIIKKSECEKMREYQARHEISLLKILIEKMPDKAKEILSKTELKPV
jgi:hypothetical protein